jgi:hypothetical protein
MSITWCQGNKVTGGPLISVERAVGFARYSTQTNKSINLEGGLTADLQMAVFARVPALAY